MRAWVLFAIATLGWMLVCARAESPPPSLVMVYHAGQYPELDWYLRAWDRDGYKTPDDGEKVDWRVYTARVDGTPQEDDLVVYKENGDVKVGLLLEVDEGKSDGKPGAYVVSPNPNGTVSLSFANKDDIYGFIRPTMKKGQHRI